MSKLETQMNVNLSGKIALVTGASRGLGRYFAKVLASNGAHVLVAGRESAKSHIEEAVKDINENDGSASSIILDLNNISSFEEVSKKIMDDFGQINILVNNAAFANDSEFFELTEENWDKHFLTNTKGLFFLSQAIAKIMKSQSSTDSIINIAAVNGQKVRKNCLPFGASKAAVIHLTKAMAHELMTYKIKVNAMSLGLFPSELVIEYLKNAPNAKEYLQSIPAKRAGELSELDGPLLMLASDASNYMNGVILQVDGGFASDIFMDLEVAYSRDG